MMKTTTCLAVLFAACLLGCVGGGKDDIDLPFVDDPQVVGTWESVDFVDTPGDFVPARRRFQGELFLKSVAFLENGKTADNWRTWTKGVLIHKNDRTASHYEIKEIGGSAYMFLEWKSGDYVFRGMAPRYYVLRRK